MKCSLGAFISLLYTFPALPFVFLTQAIPSHAAQASSSATEDALPARNSSALQDVLGVGHIACRLMSPGHGELPGRLDDLSATVLVGQTNPTGAPSSLYHGVGHGHGIAPRRAKHRLRDDFVPSPSTPSPIPTTILFPPPPSSNSSQLPSSSTAQSSSVPTRTSSHSSRHLTSSSSPIFTQHLKTTDTFRLLGTRSSSHPSSSPAPSSSSSSSSSSSASVSPSSSTSSSSLSTTSPSIPTAVVSSRSSSSKPHLLPILLGTLLPVLAFLALIAAIILYRRRRAWEETVRARTISSEDSFWVSTPGGSPPTAGGWQSLGSVPASPLPARRAHTPTPVGALWNGSDVLVLAPEPRPVPVPAPHPIPAAPVDDQARVNPYWDEKAKCAQDAWNRSPVLAVFAAAGGEGEKRKDLTASAKSVVDVDMTPSEAHGSAGADAEGSESGAGHGAPRAYAPESDAGHRIRHPYAASPDSEAGHGDSIPNSSHQNAPARPPALNSDALHHSRSPTFVTLESGSQYSQYSDRTPPTPPPHYSRPLPRIPLPPIPINKPPRPPSFTSS
ncbi:hypothetical protein C8R46DRAFT_1233726 [Mycena filopes]|nr:hypothetical protein C8R46DRAFT_1233726 [Mycena filopes]